jgi:hypothetical protein
MKRWILATVLIALAVWSAAGARARVDREALADLERRFDARIESHDPNDPFHLLGNTRGVYLEDYGVVFTSEVNLVAAAVRSPFRPEYTKEQLEQLRQKKLLRVNDLKKLMRAMMVDSATGLKSVPTEQRIAVGVSLFRFAWEDSRGLPAQIVMETRRQELLDFESGKLDSAGLDNVIRVQEF